MRPQLPFVVPSGCEEPLGEPETIRRMKQACLAAAKQLLEEMLAVDADLARSAVRSALAVDYRLSSEKTMSLGSDGSCFRRRAYSFE
jgi:hypothetical protein